MNPKISESTNDMEKFLTMPKETNLLQDCFSKESTGAGLYQLNTPIEEECFQEQTGFITRGNTRFVPSLIDIESEIRGLNYKNSKCHELKDDPLNKFRTMVPIDIVKCKPMLKTVYTKNQRACDNISLIQQNRFEYLNRPLVVQSNDFIGSNTRLEVRDSYKK